MPTKTYYLDDAKTEPIQVRWGMFWKNFTLTQHGQVLARVPNRSALKAGVVVSLADGRALSARLSPQFMQEELELLLDGQPLPGSPTHPHYRVQQAVYALSAVGGFNIVMGLIAEIRPYADLQKSGFGYPSMVEGLLYMGLVWWAQGRRSVLTFYAGIGLLLLDFIVPLVTMDAAAKPSTSGMFLRFALIAVLYNGAKAAKELQAENPPLPAA
jgi:hypothetical protein